MTIEAVHYGYKLKKIRFDRYCNGKAGLKILLGTIVAGKWHCIVPWSDV